MFDIWQRIEAKGAVVVPTKPDALTALEWVEIGERWPELVPEKFRHWDVYTDPQLIFGSPFVVKVEKSDEGDLLVFNFCAHDSVIASDLDVNIDVDELIRVLGTADFHHDDDESCFGGLLVCSCGIAGCDGLWSQTFHVSEKMVHWSVRRYDVEYELFFEREAYERGVLQMLKTLVEEPGKYALPYGMSYEIDHEAFVDSVYAMLDRRPVFYKMWEELNFENKKARRTGRQSYNDFGI